MTESSLRAKVMLGLLWSTIQSWGVKGLTLVLFMVLTRVLEPAEIGVFSAAMAVLGFVNIFVNQGLSEAIIQQPKITTQQVNAAFLINVVVSVSIFTILWFASPLVANGMKIAELSEILRVAGVALLINAICFSQQAMHSRAFNYKWLAICSIISTIIGGSLAVSMAISGYGAWSLIGQFVAASAVNAALIWLKPQWNFAFDFDFGGAWKLMRYGANRLATQLLDFANTRYVEIFLAASLGVTALGVYAVGVRVYQAIMEVLSTAILGVAHNGFSRLAGELPKLKAAYYRSVSATVAFLVPPFIFIAVMAQDLVVVVFGERWLPSAEIMQPMALLGAVQVAQFYNSTLLNSVGRPSLVLGMMVAKVFSTFFALYLFNDSSLSSVVIAYASAQLITLPIGFYIVRKVVGVHLLDVLRCSWKFMVFLAASVFIMLVLAEIPYVIGLSSIVRVAIVGSVGAVVYFGALYLFSRSYVSEIAGYIRFRRV